MVDGTYVFTDKHFSDLCKMMNNMHNEISNKKKIIKDANKIVYKIYYKMGMYSPIEFEPLFNKQFENLIDAKYMIYERLRQRNIPFKYRYPIFRDIKIGEEIGICNKWTSVAFKIVEEESNASSSDYDKLDYNL